MSIQRMIAGHRQRKVAARAALANQVQSVADQLFPGLSGCYWKVMRAKSAQVVLAQMCNPVRIRRLGPARLRRFVANRGVNMSHAKAAQIEGVSCSV